jgi:hypothetical protein
LYKKTGPMGSGNFHTGPNRNRTTEVRSWLPSTTTVSRFHNLGDEALADAIGRADAIVKGAEAELATLKDEFKARGLSEVAGDEFAVTATEQIAGRLDSKAIKAFLGDGYFKFEKAIDSTVIRIKAANRLAIAA